MEFYVLASGSNGNCSVIKSKEALVVIDCGMSWEYLFASFCEYDIAIEKADALLVTHLHRDHTRQLDKFDAIKKHVVFDLPGSEKQEFYQEFKVKDLLILPLAMSHDSPDTTGYLINDGKESLVYITDTGYLSDYNKHYLHNADYYIMESNHDPVMLLNTNRPRWLKRRIMYDDGHLSNIDCAYHLQELVGEKTKEIVLAHLSEEANSPQQALATLYEVFENNGVSLQDIKVTVARQYSGLKGGKL